MSTCDSSKHPVLYMVYVYVCICVYICMYVYAYISIYLYVYVYACVSVCVHTLTFINDTHPRRPHTHITVSEGAWIQRCIPVRREKGRGRRRGRGRGREGESTAPRVASMDSAGAPSKAMAWMLLKSGYLSAVPSLRRISITSLTVRVPWSFWPLRSSFSICSNVLRPPALTNSSAHRRLRPP